MTGFRLSPLIAASSTRPTLRLFGLLFSAILLLAAWLLRPASASTAPPAAAVAAAVAAGQHHRSPRLVFLGLWLTYALGTLAGLSAIGIASPVGIELIGVPPALAAASVSLFAVFNGLSRPLIGWPCDRWTPTRAAMLAFGLVLVGSLLMLQAGQADGARYLVAFCLFWSALGR